MLRFIRSQAKNVSPLWFYYLNHYLSAAAHVEHKPLRTLPVRAGHRRSGVSSKHSAQSISSGHSDASGGYQNNPAALPRRPLQKVRRLSRVRHRRRIRNSSVIGQIVSPMLGSQHSLVLPYL